MGWTCRGRLIRSDEEQRPLFDLWYALEGRGDLTGAVAYASALHEQAQALADTVNQGFKVPHPADRLRRDLAKGMEPWTSVRRVVFPLIRIRMETVGKPCGQDLTPTIESVPEDGEVHAYECPKCGEPGTVRRVP